ncbi:hypothetical protein HDU76_000549 [Blyttiomyces sp. JEL0837]|nr:hypothetical protein HDU76_000549 [Blyttiomyces sp. JEL0837]
MPTASWESAVETDRLTLRFPPDEEKAFLREHCASQNARMITMFLYILSLIDLVFFIISSVYLATDDEDPFQYWIISSSFAAGLQSVGVIYQWFRSEEGYKKDVSRYVVPLPALFFCLSMIPSITREENFVYSQYLLKFRASQLGVFVTTLYTMSGISARSSDLLPMGCFLNLFPTVQNLIVIAHYPSWLSFLRSLGGLAPIMFTNIIAFTRAYHTELSFRIQFSGLKMAQCAIQKVAVIERTMESLLENSLPKAVIPRLIASEFMFSTVSDRIDHAYCFLIDFFEPKVIKTLDAESAAEVLNDTFSAFDDLLIDFPMIEKIKTITSKALLMSTAESQTPVFGPVITDFVEKVFTQFDGRLCKLTRERRMIHCKVHIGVAFGPVVAGIVGEEKFIYDIYSDTVNCGSLWRSLGNKDVKGKGKMEVFTLDGIDFSEHDDTLPVYSPSGFPNFGSYKLDVTMLQSQRRPSIFQTIHSGFALLASPVNLPDVTKDSASFSLSIIGRPSVGVEKQTTVLSLTTSSHKSSKGRVVPVDMSRYINDSLGALTNGTEAKERLSNAALNNIIVELAPLIETATTDSLNKHLSQYISPFTLKFNANEIEMKYRNRIKGRVQAHAEQHSRVMCYMMIFFAVIVPFYEIFLAGQVGFDIEQRLRDGTATVQPESGLQRIGRIVATSEIFILALIQIAATSALSKDIRSQNTYEPDDTFGKQKGKTGYDYFKFMRLLFGSSDQPKLGHLQYSAHIFLVLLFGVALLAGTTFSNTWWGVGAVATMIDSAISLTSGITVNFRTRVLASVLCDFIICFIRNSIETVTYTEWLFAFFSVFTSMFIVYQTEYSEKVGFLLEETLKSSQMAFDRRAFVSAGLLKAVIPKRLISRLAVDTDQSLIVEQFSMITILHLDIVSFTVLSGSLQPVDLIKLLNAIFSTFDQICKTHQVEKILTIGDAYIAAKLCEPNVTYDDQDQFDTRLPRRPESASSSNSGPGSDNFSMNAKAVCHVGLDMQRALVAREVEYQGVRIRVGIHSGPASGFMTGGITKLKYELIGDTVDLAEKVQEKARPGTVFASQTTALLLPVGVVQLYDTGITIERNLRLWQVLPLEGD